jgi:hypothetical protein
MERESESISTSAIAELASHLYRTMEHLDPGPDPEFIHWDDLNDHSKIIWVETIYSLLEKEDLILRALKEKSGR